MGCSCDPSDNLIWVFFRPLVFNLFQAADGLTSDNIFTDRTKQGLSLRLSTVKILVYIYIYIYVKRKSNKKKNQKKFFFAGDKTADL